MKGSANAMKMASLVGTVAVLILAFQVVTADVHGYGKEIGQLSSLDHGVAGTVYAVDESTIFIKGFSFDGIAPDTFFWVGDSSAPSTTGQPLFLDASESKLGYYNDVNLFVNIPAWMKITDFKWISVWCRMAEVNFGEVYIPAGFEAPAPFDLGPLPTVFHGVKADKVWILDTRTVKLMNFSYDGEGPDTFFWAGNTAVPDNNGFWLYWTAGRNQVLPLGKAFSNENVTVTLPYSRTIADITYISVWCREFTVDFGHVNVTSSAALNIPPKKNVPYSGARIGQFPDGTTNNVKGEVFAVDQSRILIEDFSYDGMAADAVLWVGNSSAPSSEGMALYLDAISHENLELQDGDRVVVTMPENTKITDFKWLSVWDRSKGVDLGHMMISADLELPDKQDLGPLPTFFHAVKADSVWVLNAKTLLFVNFFYDGAGPDTYFTAGSTETPDGDGFELKWTIGNSQRIPNGRAFNGENVTVIIPDDKSLFDLTYVSVWCYEFVVDFGSVSFNRSNLNVPPFLEDDDDVFEFDNCKVLIDNEFQVRWQIVGSYINIRLKGRVGPRQYMAFGLSGSDTKTLMEGSDVTVVWEKPGEFPTAVAVDFNLQSRQQCNLRDEMWVGACDDKRAAGVDNIERFSLDETDDGIRNFAYVRKLDTGDVLDKVIPTDREVYISWAIGGINSAGMVGKHTQSPVGDVKMNFGMPSWCPEFMDKTDPAEPAPWALLRLNNVQDFMVEIGPDGGRRGYGAITGQVGWGIAWYVNELLIPEIYVVRGMNYSFTVFGGHKNTSDIFHPFYITNDTVGGYYQQSEEEREYTTIYAGPHDGPYCEWKVSGSGIFPDDFDSFAAYKENLQQNCSNPDAPKSTFYWTPDSDTPDLVYYQCYTHRFLGWKIHVTDELVVFPTDPPKTTKSSARAYFPSMVLLVITSLVGLLL